MPNRILRDWTDSEAVNSVSCQAERFFTRLLMKVDDYGRLFANPKLLRPSMFPLLLDQVREADVQRWTAECEKAGLIRLYTAGGKQFLEVPNFNQRTRAIESKYPDPPPESAPKPDDGHVTVKGPAHDGHPLTYSETKAQANAHAETKTGRYRGRGIDGLPVVPDSLRVPEFETWWAKWQEHRRQKRAKLTPLAAEQQLDKCEKWGADLAVAAIKHSIGNGWTGLFPPDRQESPRGPRAEELDPADEAMIEEMARERKPR